MGLLLGLGCVEVGGVEEKEEYVFVSPRLSSRAG